MKDKLLFISPNFVDETLVSLSYLEYALDLKLMIAKGLYFINQDQESLSLNLQEAIIVGYNLEKVLNLLSEYFEIKFIDYLDLEVIAYKYLDKLETINQTALIKYYGIYNPTNKYLNEDNLVNLRLFKALVKDFKIDISKWLTRKENTKISLKNDYSEIIDKLNHGLSLTINEKSQLALVIKDSQDIKLMIKSLKLVKLIDILKTIKLNQRLSLSNELQLKLYLEEHYNDLDDDLIEILKLILKTCIYKTSYQLMFYQYLKAKSLLK